MPARAEPQPFVCSCRNADILGKYHQMNFGKLAPYHLDAIVD